ncbi:MAG TPA: ACT domain-containing protein [Candidatus Paceibacterota bacterium]|nr:ACT domain-containing protein [Verrucomicrobiota bacterium]HOX00864.1 ACT domain-containing protein [Verrucomicrobiota bacterium]HRZ43611.1 ACT domain-containing protein [Candidatus Paceibacterota bacterium]
MSTIKEVAVFAENKLGQMAIITKVLADAGVNIRWVTIATTETFGVIKFLVDRCDEAFAALRQKGFTVSLIDVLAIEVPDKPGGLFEVADTLRKNAVNVENASGFVTQSQKRAVLLIEVKDIDRAEQVLKKKRLRLLGADEALKL